MSTELILLAASIVLGIIYLCAASAAITKIKGPAWNMSARDDQGPKVTGVAARLDRAFKNFQETFPFFVAAIVINEFLARTSGQSNTLAVIGAHLYFWARVVYLPLYAAGIPVVRTLVWVTSIIGIFLVLSTVLFV